MNRNHRRLVHGTSLNPVAHYFHQSFPSSWYLNNCTSSTLQYTYVKYVYACKNNIIKGISRTPLGTCSVDTYIHICIIIVIIIKNQPTHFFQTYINTDAYLSARVYIYPPKYVVIRTQHHRRTERVISLVQLIYFQFFWLLIINTSI